MKRSAWKRILAGAAILAVIGFGAGAEAQQGAFDRADTNKDKRLDSMELDAEGRKIFHRHDEDRNGVLDREEFSRIPHTRSRFEDLDKDKDGRLSPEELRNAAAGRHRACDANADGHLDEDEVRECFKGGDPADPKRRLDLFSKPKRDGESRMEKGAIDVRSGGEIYSPSYDPTVSPAMSIYF